MNKFFRCGAVFALALAAGGAFAQSANTADLSWTAPTVDVSGAPLAGAVSYRVYQGVAGQPKTFLTAHPLTSLRIASGLATGNRYCWHVTAVQTVNGIPSAESAPSAEACKSFQTPPTPAAVTGLEAR